ncbi:protein N-terminal amidase [Entomortierella parvispora]|uniref:Protein N-terminal amidase n=1 Tax=Entomortierella parvispora TaxID=205924 RepID=A0A9P3HKK4_9FUNG|nr:protein N-terminal amidase [Entomortierella parvispora]
MKICCLQLEPKLGQVQENINHATDMIAHLKPEDVDVLVLPEMAFTGYVFKSKDHIRPYLEDSKTGPSVTWAMAQAIRLNAHVVVGYPERRVVNPSDPTKEQFYNSIAFVSPTGQLLTTYAKHFLYYTDENWAEEGPAFESIHVPGLGQVGFGICMDVNPYRFQSAFQEMEFSTFHLKHKSDLILCSMAWNKGEEAPKKEKVLPKPKSEKSKARLAKAKAQGELGEGEGVAEDEDDDEDWEDEESDEETTEEKALRLEEEAQKLRYETIQYWALRMSPFYDQKSKPPHKAHIVIANRIGTEDGNLFVGSSCVMHLTSEGPRLCGVLSANTEGVLKVHT